VTNTLEVSVTQRADIAIQMVWSDDQGAPVPCGLPARAEVKDSQGALLVAFDDEADPSTAAAITCSATSGVIQLTAPKTVTTPWTPGKYKVDVFATVSDAAPPFDSGQYRPAFSGWFIVKPAVTTGAP
jgi:hypothetical protein